MADTNVKIRIATGGGDYSVEIPNDVPVSALRLQLCSIDTLPCTSAFVAIDLPLEQF